MVSDLALIALFAFDAFILTVGSVSDVYTRKVNSYLFVAPAAGGVVYDIFSGSPAITYVPVFAMFAACFFLRGNLIYLLIQTAIFTISLFLSLLLGFGSISLIVAYVYALMGYREFIGIGDVKAMLALTGSFAVPFFGIISGGPGLLISFIPVPFFFMLNSTVLSAAYIPYLLLLNFRRGTLRKRYSFYAIAYDEKEYGKAEHKYRLRDLADGKVMVYKMPFLVPITAGFLIAMITGI